MAANNSTRQAALLPGVTVGVIGAGAMGAGIAQVAALAGHPVLLFDARAGAAADAIASIHVTMAKLVAKGHISSVQAESVHTGLRPIATLEACAGCGLIIEAIVENLEAKKELFRCLEAVVAEDVLLATNTSSLSITAIAGALRHPERLAGMHFFNPATRMPLVEIITGAATSLTVAQTLYATATAWGKVPVLARSTPGFIVNRVARPFYAEALRTLNEGAADCATIDAILREAGGFRMGAFELMDLIGNDVNYAVTRSVFDAFYGDPRFMPSQLQLELVEAGFLGCKSGRGFYDYREGAIAAQPSTHPPCSLPARITIFGGDATATALIERLAAGGVAVERRSTHVDLRLAQADGLILYRTDGRTATERAESLAETNVVLVDLALDPATAARLAIARADQAGSQALDAAAGLLQAAGFSVSAIDDIAGMIVMRTVCMLANEAADAVHQGVCSAADCDLAMRKGMNFPQGPLAWADDLGAATVVRTLEHLLATTGAGRYRVAPLLRRNAISGVPLCPIETLP